MDYKKVKYLSVLIFVLQITGIGIWFFVERPGKDYLFNTLAISLFLLGFNLVVALVFYILKKRGNLNAVSWKFSTQPFDFYCMVDYMVFIFPPLSLVREL